MLQLRLLGQFDVRLDGKRIIIPSRAGQSLLAYLALTAGTLHRREKLAGVFWPDTNDENARKNLRQELWRIRKAISSLEPSQNDFLVADEFTLKFNNSATYWLDVAQLERPDHDLQSLIANLSLYQGELLPGFYDDWVGIERERVQGIFDLRMEELLEQLSASERWSAVQEWGERWLTLCGARESAYRYLMLASGARGEAAKVAALYRRCQDDMLEQLGVEPSAETQSLYEGLLRSTKFTMRAPAQPSGTITFLFTDIEGSTRLLEMLGDQYAVALDEHHEILRAAVKKWNGREIDTQGDAFFVTFSRALDAVQCAAEAQRALTEHVWQSGEGLRVRMGIHTGEPLIASTGYVGMDVHRAARIGDAGHGGQILLSQSTRELVHQELPAGLTIRELGEHRLKDMKYPTAIYQLIGEGLPDNFAPIRTRFTGMEAPTPGEPPFKGLQFFDEQDVNLFFGREALTSKLIRHLQNANFLSVIIGASGSGKSSLVRAGLVPALKKGIALSQASPLSRSSSDWVIQIMTPTAHPLEALAIELTRASESVTAVATLLDDLSKDPRSLHFFLSRQSSLQHTVLVIDQFEELFTLCHDDFEREAFIDNLLAALKPAPLPLGEARSGESRLTLIITLRADFYAHLAQFSELRDAIAQQQEYIGPMTSEELRRAIEEPAHLGHWEFEPGLVDLILRDVGDEPGALPLLSHALLETWKRRAGHTLTLKGYAEAGGVRGAIAYTAESLYQDLSHSEQAIMRNILLRLTEFGEGTEDTRRRASFEELLSQANDPEPVRAVLNRLAEARLVTLGEETAEVAHEALIREWPKLREWLSQDREGILLHRHLTEAAQEWSLLERDVDALYRGLRLAQANEWSALNLGALNVHEKMFLEASNGRAMQEVQEREEQRRRELDMQRQRADEQMRAAVQLRRRAMLLTGALIIAGILAVAAGVFGQRANQEARLAASRELAAASISNLEVDPERSILLALHAVSTADTLEAEDALHQAVQASRVRLTLSGHADWVNRVAFSADGTQLATASDDGTTKVWDALSGQELLTLTGHGDWVMGVAYSPDGTRLATVGNSGTAKVWDANTGDQLLSLNVNMDFAWGISFSPDGKRLAISGPAREAEVWDATTGRKLFNLVGHTDGIWDVAFNSDGTLLATASWDQTARVWDAQTGELLLTLTSHTGTVRSVAFSPTGKYLATAADDNTAKVWNLATGTELFNISVHTSPVFGVAFSPDGQRLVTASTDQTVKMWQLNYSLDGNTVTGQKLFTLSGHTDPITGLDISPDGTRLATASGDRTARIWDVSFQGGKELLTLSSLDASSNSIAFSPDGKRLGTSSNDGTGKLWDVNTGQKLFDLKGHTGPVGFITFSPDGRYLGTASIDGTGKVWDVRTGKALLTLSGHTDLVNSIAFSPDSQRIATVSQDKTAIVWDAKTGKELIQLTPQLDPLLVVIFSPDGMRLATAGYDGVPKIWDAATGQLLLALKSQAYYTDQLWRIWGIAFSPNGTLLATAGQDGVARIWDTKTGGVLLTLTGHTGEVVTVTFSADGSRLATSSRDGTAKIWDVATGQNLLTLQAGDGGGLSGASFDSAGEHLATSGDRGVRVFALRIGELVALARSRLTRSLTTEECQKYLHMETCPLEP